MLKAIAIDDELIALERFQRISGQDERILLLGCFTKAQEAMVFLENNTIDVVFLDIEMPKMNGLELSEQIFEIRPEIDVVFVTAYDKYALQAIQAHAMGYLLKPIELEDITQQTEKLIKKRLAKGSISLTRNLSVSCLGQFKIFTDENQAEPVKWRTSKAEELFAYLIHCQGKEISKERLIDILWPEMDVKKVNNNLHVTCHYLRDVLNEKGYGEVFVRSRGSYCIKLDGFKCDLIDLLNLMEATKGDLADIVKLESIAALYKGPYLDDKGYEWAMDMRSWLESEYERHMHKLVNIYCQRGAVEQAIELLKKMVLFIPSTDEAYKRLVELSLELKDYASARHYYERYKKILLDEIGIEPPDELVKLIKFK